MNQNVALSIVEERESLQEEKDKMNEKEYDSDDSLSRFSSLFAKEGDSDYDSEEEDEELLVRYYQQINETDGFDVTEFPGGWHTSVMNWTYYLKNPKYVDKIKDYAGKALNLYNDSNGTSYEVKDILKLNAGGGGIFNYYITFSVTTPCGEVAIFQAKVEEDLRDNLKFLIVRLKVVKALMG